MLGYCHTDKKFLSVDVWFGLCENSHNAKAKNEEVENIIIFFEINGPNGKKVSMLGVEVFFCGKFVENGPNAKKVYTYRVRGKFF